MWKSIRRIVLCAVLLTGLGVMTPATVRADPPDQSDYNAVWQYAQGPQLPDPADGYNAYYQEVQDKQLAEPGQ
jgi:hypothetical protein